MNLKYFKESEFKACTPSCKSSQCEPCALELLDTLRELCGFPIHLNSAYRSKNYEKTKGRAGTSSHCKGVAFDLRCYDSHERFLLVRNAIAVGFNRIGIAERFIHIDCDSSKPQNLIWNY